MLARLPAGLQGFYFPSLCLERWEMHKQGVCCYQAHRYKILATPPSSSCFGVNGKMSLWGGLGCVVTGAATRVFGQLSATGCVAQCSPQQVGRSAPLWGFPGSTVCPHLQPVNKTCSRRRPANWMAPLWNKSHFLVAFLLNRRISGS